MSQLPDKERLAAFIRENPDQAGKRELARAFGLKGAQRIELKRMLNELADEGVIERRAKKSFAAPGQLPPVSVLIAGAPDANGDLFATPQDWDRDEPAPRILILPGKGPAPGEGDRLLTRVNPVTGEDHQYLGKVIKRIGAGPRRMLGIFRRAHDGAGRLVPVAKGDQREWVILPRDAGEAENGELVEAEQISDGPQRRRAIGLPKARITERLGAPGAARTFSLIAIHEQGIPDAFPEEVEAAAEAAEPVEGLKGREDLRHLPLVTIDPADARDHDDAVAAMPDPDKANKGGHIVWVAIADVAHYVRPGGALDREAIKRGNSTYFPDRVVPMLPEALSADLCSLVEGEDRPCIALRMVLDETGELKTHDFHRGIMRSPASLTYEQAQAAADGRPDPATEPHLEVLAALFAAYDCASIARERRQPLELDLPERRIRLDEAGAVASVGFRERLEAHKLIEEFMILANVCAAETLEARRRPLLYRVHEVPGEAKLDALREVAEGCGLTLSRGQIPRPALFNRLLRQAAGSDFAELVNLSVLRAQTQAYYGPDNLGHFGLNLRAYAHFTSPIRRYADLVVHRALIAAHGWGNDGQTGEEMEGLKDIAEHISFTERRSMTAERDTNDRYLAAYLAERVGNEFEGRIAGVARFGLFVKLDETGADGLIPIASLGREWFRHDADAQTLTGEDSGRVIGLGQRVLVKLQEAAPVTGGLLLELLEVEGESGPRPRGRNKAPRKKIGGAGIARAKAKRKPRRH
ncbi:RNAse R [Albimonas donghaensis]|uniref:Ribonuclease R n=1 Tax=Albimonas donghaensis TaxID=356660 RepID=A0A1H3EXX4_9RHOB|nr:ribonuclease R [Albimonas donghaensis]SDX83673.1 RNAse R [Albimonas donghaensis]